MTNLAEKKLIMLGVCMAAFAMPIMAKAQGVKETEASRALVRLDELEAQIRELTNRVEILESQNATLRDALEKTNAAKEAPKPIVNIVSEQQDIVEPAAAPMQMSSTAAPVAAEPKAVEAPAPAPITTPSVFDATKILQTAKTQIQAGQYQNAEAILTDFTDNHADDVNAPEAFWLLGETRYVQQAWAPAAQAYVAYLNKAPTGPKVPDVLVRIAGAFRELGDNNQRCKALSEYKRRAPNPSAILKARADAEIAKAPCP
jgi:TolA-binding protein